MKTPVPSAGCNAVAAIETILVPVDCGHRSLALLRSASALARRVGARLVLLHVYEPITYAPAHCDAVHLHECARKRHSEAEQKLEEIRRSLPDDPEVQSARLVAVGGYPEHEICVVAHETRADLIVACTHGYRGFNHFFLGSKAEQLIRSAPCPLLILPPLNEGAEEEDVIGLRRQGLDEVVI
jgi:universal stress protein A